MIFAMPYKIHNGSGGPTRVFALPTATYMDRIDLRGKSSATQATFSLIALSLSTMLLYCFN